MPPRKEPKEAIVYPPSKRKTPAFKPLRPPKHPRTSTTTSESSAKSNARPAIVESRRNVQKDGGAKRLAVRITLSDSEDEIGVRDSKESESDASLSESGATWASKTAKTALPSQQQTSLTRENTAMSIPVPPNDEPPMPSPSDEIPSIPQPLLIRLLHESFADKNMRIDKHAIQVLQKYIEIFVREAIARAQLEKQEAVARGEVGEMEERWLELADLEKVAGGMMLDF